MWGVFWGSGPLLFKIACKFYNTAPLVANSSFAKYACRLHTHMVRGCCDKHIYFLTMMDSLLIEAIVMSVCLIIIISVVECLLLDIGLHLLLLEP